MFELTELEVKKEWPKSQKIKLSVCCITFQQEKYVGQMIEGILSQKTDFAYEIIIGEDCSTDSTLQIIKSYQNKFPSIIKIITSEHNVGGMKNLWRVLNDARGEFISCCEGDDYWIDESKLQSQVEFLEKNPTYSTHIFDCYELINEQLDENSSKVRRLNIKTGSINESQYKKDFYFLLLTACFRNLGDFEFPNYFNKSTSGDALLNMMLASKGKAFVDNSKKVAVYRIHGNGVWSMISASDKYYESMHSALIHAQYLSKHNDSVYLNKLFSVALNTIKQISIPLFLTLLMARVFSHIFKKIPWK